MNAFTSWVNANPVLFTVVLWPVVSGLVTALFKSRTPEEYAAMNPRVAAVLKLVGSLGLDVPNMLNALKQVVAGHAASAESYRARREAVGQPSPPSSPVAAVVAPTITEAKK